ncbi:hypothetical protein C0993_003170 [Termitomyces sp. T159_Od127]|nr:hypothetical protein C0993_003170 [Termitomyces sp. T159_Od127]
MASSGGTDVHHRSTIQRGPSPSGPWENNPNNPILFNGADLTNAVQDTGHADIVQGTDGKWWGVALGHIPDVLPDVSALAPYTNNFTSDTLDNSFYFVRTPYKTFHSLTARNGYLRLFANSYAPGDRDSAALLLRKQTAYTETFETRLDGFKPTTNLTEAGVSVYYGDSLHNEIGVTGGDDGRYIVVRTIVLNQQVGPWALTTANATVITVQRYKLTTDDANVRFKVLASPASYSLGYAEGDNAEFAFPTMIDSSALSVAPAGGFFFKGASFGVYNTGNGKPSLISADFKYWQQTPTTPSLNSGTFVH